MKFPQEMVMHHWCDNNEYKCKYNMFRLKYLPPVTAPEAAAAAA